MNAKIVTDSNNIELARNCLALISDIAGRGACSQDPEQIGYALQELSQVLFERTGNEDRVFEPVPADQIGNLHRLHAELDFIHSLSQDMAASAHRCGFVGLWMHRLGFSMCGCETSRTTQAQSLSRGTWN